MLPCPKDVFAFNGNSTIKLQKLVLKIKISWVMTSCLDLQHKSHSLKFKYAKTGTYKLMKIV
jgi:hypothetical protein